jgi:CBS domain-containing protein
MNVEQVLNAKGGETHTISPDESLQALARRLTETNAGLLVCVDRSNGIVGVASERDIARTIARHGAQALDMSISMFMSRDVVACGLGDDVDALLSIMTETRCRHLPVVQDGQLVGLVSIGDLVKSRLPRLNGSQPGCSGDSTA